MNKKSKFKKYTELFLTFFKIGLFTFGGGYAMIPIIQKEASEKKHWIEESDMLEIIAISESTPGPISLNTATFIGYQTAGFPGAFFSTLGIVTPSFIIILALSYFIEQFLYMKTVVFAFNGIRAGALALIAKAFIAMSKQCPRNIFSYTIAAAAFILVVFLKANALTVIAGSALTGLAYSFIIVRGKDGER